MLTIVACQASSSLTIYFLCFFSLIFSVLVTPFSTSTSSTAHIHTIHFHTRSPVRFVTVFALLLLTSVVIDLVLPGRGLTSTPKSSRLASAPRCHRSSLAGKVDGAFAPTDRQTTTTACAPVELHAPRRQRTQRWHPLYNKKSRAGFFIAKSKSPTTTTTTVIAAAAAAAATPLECGGHVDRKNWDPPEELFFFHSYLFPSYYPSITINNCCRLSSFSSINCTVIFYK
ncbi:conserved hypothetical protein [Trichinella spiralis]|uniref:Uncharacterized protein n=1 Tax=Trichinella spiralis TaxID=6334 RepID=E5S1G9_TRISP|nr:conserved hypothetical protein [Trichinella spiralis]KRY39863.1 hypothetical protein T01_3515 [Trichinella spiralis]